MTKILVFGTSTTWGAYDTEGGWVERLKNYFNKKALDDDDFYLPVYNLGISGDTTYDILERFEFETKQRLKEDDGDIVLIFETGGNDSSFIHSKNSLKYSIKEFQNNLKKLIDLAKKYSSNIIFVGLTPVEDSKTSPVSWDANLTYKNEYTKQFDGKLKEVCEKNKVSYIYMFDKLDKNDLEDGLHPNNKGHKKMFKIIKENLKLN